MSKITVTTIAGLTSGGDANTVKIESGDTLAVQTNATVGGTLGVTGVSTLNGGVVLNENSADVDFRVESDANTHALFLEGSTGNIGIGTSSPPSYGSTFTVLQANNTGSGIVQANNSTNSVTTEIESEGTRGAVGTRTNHDFVIKTNQTERMRITSGSVGIGTDDPRVVSNYTILGINNSSGAAIDFELGEALKTTMTQSSGQFEINVSANLPLQFKTNNTERMRLMSDGGFAVGNQVNGTTRHTKTTKVLFTNTNTTAGTSDSVLHLGRLGTGLETIMCISNGYGEVGSIKTSGQSTSYNTSSDYRLKENVVTDWDATSRLKQLKPSRFNFKTDKDTTVDGFLAHEVSSIVPEAISGEKDAVDKESNPEYQSIDQSKLVPLMVKTIQELEARLTALESK